MILSASPVAPSVPPAAYPGRWPSRSQNPEDPWSQLMRQRRTKSSYRSRDRLRGLSLDKNGAVPAMQRASGHLRYTFRCMTAGSEPLQTEPPPDVAASQVIRPFAQPLRCTPVKYT